MQESLFIVHIQRKLSLIRVEDFFGVERWMARATVLEVTPTFLAPGSWRGVGMVTAIMDELAK